MAGPLLQGLLGRQTLFHASALSFLPRAPSPTPSGVPDGFSLTRGPSGCWIGAVSHTRFFLRQDLLTSARVWAFFCRTPSQYTVGHPNLSVCCGPPPRLTPGPSSNKGPFSLPRPGRAFSAPQKSARHHAVLPFAALWTMGQLHGALHRKWVVRSPSSGIISGT